MIKRRFRMSVHSGGGREAGEQGWRNYMITNGLPSGPTLVLWGGLMDVFTLLKIIIVSK